MDIIYACMDSYYYVLIHASCTSIQYCLESYTGWYMGWTCVYKWVQSLLTSRFCKVEYGHTKF